MGWLKTKRVRITSIVLPGNFSATKAADRITKLATLIRRTGGLIHFPVVEAKTMRLLAGHDRIAAVMQLGDTHVEVRFWEGTQKEFRETQIIENLGRRSGDDRDALIAELAKTAARNELEVAETKGITQPAVSQADRPTLRVSEQAKAAHGNAVAAAAADTTAAAVSTAKWRAKRKKSSAVEPSSSTPREPAAPAEEPALLPEDFNVFGIAVARGDVAAILALRERLVAWAQQTQAILAELTRIENGSTLPLSAVNVTQIRNAVHGAGHAIREAVPAMLCPYCKTIDRALCPACGGTGIAGRHGLDNVPAALKVGGGVAQVARAGRFVLVSGLGQTTQGGNVGPPAAAVNGRAAKKIRVEYEDGTPVPPPADDDEVAFE